MQSCCRPPPCRRFALQGEVYGGFFGGPADPSFPGARFSETRLLEHAPRLVGVVPAFALGTKGRAVVGRLETSNVIRRVDQ